MGLDFAGFSGVRPKVVSGRRLPEGVARQAANCNLALGGSLGPLLGLGPGAALAQAGPLASLYEMAPGQWLAWAAQVAAVRLPIAESDGRIAFTGDGFPKQTDLTLATGGLPATWPSAVRRLGVKPPTAPLTIEFIGVAGAAIIATPTYRYTLVTSWGEESAPSDPTPVVTVYAGQSLRLTGMAWDATSDNNYDRIRFYRSEKGETEEAVWLFYDEILISIAEYVDAFTQTAGPDLLETEDWEVPPADLHGLFAFGNGVLAGISGHGVRLSVPWVAYAWPASQELPADEAVVAAGFFDQTIVYCTAGKQYRAQGTDPQYMSSSAIDYSPGCDSAASLVSTPGGVFYGGPDGLVYAHAGGNTLVTEESYSPEQWQALGTNGLMGFYWRGQYLGFFVGTANGIMVDSKTLTVMPLGLAAAVYGGHHDRETGVLTLLCEEGGVWQRRVWFSEAAAAQPFTWESGERQTGAATVLSCGKLTGDFSAGSSVTLRVLADGQVRYNKTFTRPGSFRLRPGKGTWWQLLLSGTAQVDKVALKGSMAELRHG